MEQRQSKDVPWDDEEYTAKPDVLVFTDAEGNGGAGAIVYPMRPRRGAPRAYYTASRVPVKWQSNLLGRKTQINVYEQAAVLLALGTFPDLLRGKRVVFYIDSMSALGTIVKGHSRRDDLNLYAGTTWHLLARYGVTPHFLRVPSKQNPADDPSRGCVAELDADPNVERRKAEWPPWASGLTSVVGEHCGIDYSW